MVAIQKVGTNVNVIPKPPSPKVVDEDPANYVPKGLTETERRDLREAALEWTGTLGGFLGRTGAGMTGRGAAAQNMRHFRTGNGADLTLSNSFVDGMAAQSPQLTRFQNGRLKQFLELIKSDLAGQSTGTAGQYLLMNDEAGPNRGTNWYGLTSSSGTAVFFTVGAFMVSYGAVGVRGRSAVNITYKMYIWDRYNWDSNKETPIPGNQLSWLLNDSEMDDIAGMQTPGFSPADYFRRTVDSEGNITYTVNDALMGSLVEGGDAQNFSIVGAGNVQTISLPVAASAAPASPAGGPPAGNAHPQSGRGT